MEKAILMSATPNECCNVLNFIQSLFVRKKFPKDYRGWVYLYCSKRGGRLLEIGDYELDGINRFMMEKDCDYDLLECSCDMLNGEVVARFYCDNVQRIYIKYGLGWTWDGINNCAEEIEKESCLSRSKIYEYAGNSCYAVHISQLEIFDSPKALNELYKNFSCKYNKSLFSKDIHKEIYKEKECLVQPIKNGYEYSYKLTKAPSNYCYIIEE